MSWNQVNILAVILLATPKASATLLYVRLDSNFLRIHQAMDYSRPHCHDIFQSPFLETIAKRLNFITETTKNNSFCKISISAVILFLIFDIMNVDLHMKFSSSVFYYSTVDVLFYVNYQ